MSETNYQKICSEYYELSLRMNPSDENDRRLSEILDFAVNDPELSSRIADIDAEIFDKNLDLEVLSKEKIANGITRIKRLIESHPIVDETNNIGEEIAAFEIRVSIAKNSSAYQLVTDYISTVTSFNKPTLVFFAFQKIFIELGDSFNNSMVVDAIREILALDDSFESFFNILHDCIYIPINKWLMKPQYHLDIVELIDLFDQKSILLEANNIRPDLLEALLGFTQTSRFSNLLLLPNFIRYKTYKNSSDLEAFKDKCERASHLAGGYTGIEQQNLPILSEKIEHADASDYVFTRLKSYDVQCQTSRNDNRQHLSAVLTKIVRRVYSKAKQMHSSYLSENRKLHQVGTSSCQGVVVTPIALGQVGRIKVHGVYWLARLNHEDSNCYLSGGSIANIASRSGNTLLVEAPTVPVVVDSPMTSFKKPFIGIVEACISARQTGKIKTLGGILWSAKLHEGFLHVQLVPGDSVKVVARHGNTYVVTPSDPLPGKSVAISSNVPVPLEHIHIRR